MEQVVSAYKSYKYRWVVLAVYMYISALTQLYWLNFASIETFVEQRFIISASTVMWLTLVFPLVQVILSMPAGAAGGVASILVPLVVSTTAHQRTNAEFMAAHGAAIHLPQSDLTPARLAELLVGLNRERLQAMAKSARSLGRPDATRIVADAIEHIAREAGR